MLVLDFWALLIIYIGSTNIMSLFKTRGSSPGKTSPSNNDVKKKTEQ